MAVLAYGDSEQWLHMTDLAKAVAELAEDLSISNTLNLGVDAPVTSSLIASLEELAMRLANLPMSAEWELIILQEGNPLSDHAQDGSLNLAGLLKWLTGACESVRAAVQKRGTASDTVQMRAVADLAALYGRLLPRAPTFSVRESRVYTGVPRTAFGCMVKAFFEEFEPEPAKRRGLRSACMWAIKERRKQRNGAQNQHLTP
jgi:hypothetical protein